MEQGGGIFEALNGHIYGNITSNQTLVLAHGFGVNQDVWRYLIPFLACYFKVVVFDLAFSPHVRPGLYDPNRYSNYTAYADDLLGVLDELKVKRAIYLGHSMSAMIGCIAAVQKPELFEHLILLNGSPRYLNDKDYKGGYEKSEIDIILQQIKQNYASWIQSFAPNAIVVNSSIAILGLEQSLKKMNPSITLSVAKTVFLSDWRPILPLVEVPATIIQSKVDFVIPKFVVYYMKEELGHHARVIILASQGHFPMLTAYHLLLKVLNHVLFISD